MDSQSNRSQCFFFEAFRRSAQIKLSISPLQAIDKAIDLILFTSLILDHIYSQSYIHRTINKKK